MTTFGQQVRKKRLERGMSPDDEGRFALIRGDVVKGIYDTYRDALTVGYEKFGLEPFRVTCISTTEPVQYFTRDITHKRTL